MGYELVRLAKLLAPQLFFKISVFSVSWLRSFQWPSQVTPCVLIWVESDPYRRPLLLRETHAQQQYGRTKFDRKPPDLSILWTKMYPDVHTSMHHRDPHW